MKKVLVAVLSFSCLAQANNYQLSRDIEVSRHKVKEILATKSKLDKRVYGLQKRKAKALELLFQEEGKQLLSLLSQYDGRATKELMHARKRILSLRISNEKKQKMLENLMEKHTHLFAKAYRKLAMNEYAKEKRIIK